METFSELYLSFKHRRECSEIILWKTPYYFRMHEQAYSATNNLIARLIHLNLA